MMRHIACVVAMCVVGCAGSPGSTYSSTSNTDDSNLSIEQTRDRLVDLGEGNGTYYDTVLQFMCRSMPDHHGIERCFPLANAVEVKDGFIAGPHDFGCNLGQRYLTLKGEGYAVAEVTGTGCAVTEWDPYVLAPM